MSFRFCCPAFGAIRIIAFFLARLPHLKFLTTFDAFVSKNWHNVSCIARFGLVPGYHEFPVSTAYLKQTASSANTSATARWAGGTTLG